MPHLKKKLETILLNGNETMLSIKIFFMKLIFGHTVVKYQKDYFILVNFQNSLTDFSKSGKVIPGQFLWLYDNFCMSYSKFSTKKCYVFYNIGFPIHFEIQPNFKRSYLETGLIFFDSVKSSWSFKGGRVSLDQKINNQYFLPRPPLPPNLYRSGVSEVFLVNSIGTYW